MPWSAVAKVVAPVVLSKVLNKGSSSTTPQTTTQQNQIDPRIAEMLFGNQEGQQGLLSKYMSQLDKPQSDGLKTLGAGTSDWLGRNGMDSLINQSALANAMQFGGNTSASQRYSPAAQADLFGTQVNAPAQNNMNLSRGFNDVIYGNEAENPYLTGAIQRGINQGMASFDKMKTDMSRNLTEDILPHIRSGAIASGNLGGSRQALTEGKALNNYITQLGRASDDISRNSIDAAIAAQAQAFDAGRGRAVGTMNNLNSSQYGVASQNAGNVMQGRLQNAQMQNQNNQFYANLGQNNNQFNANAKNNNIWNSINAQRDVFGNIYGMANNADNYNLNRMGQVNNLLSPYLNVNGSSTQSTPMYENRTAQTLGNAAAIGALTKNVNWGDAWNGVKGMFGPNTIGTGI